MSQQHHRDLKGLKEELSSSQIDFVINHSARSTRKGKHFHIVFHIAFCSFHNA